MEGWGHSNPSADSFKSLPGPLGEWDSGNLPTALQQFIGKQEAFCIIQASCHGSLYPFHGNGSQLLRVTGGFRAVRQERLTVTVMWADSGQRSWRPVSGWWCNNSTLLIYLVCYSSFICLTDMEDYLYCHTHHSRDSPKKLLTLHRQHELFSCCQMSVDAFTRHFDIDERHFSKWSFAIVAFIPACRSSPDPWPF